MRNDVWCIFSYENRETENKYHTLFNVGNLVWQRVKKRTNKRTNKTMILVKYGYFTKSSAHADAFLFVDLINKTNLPKQTKAMPERIQRWEKEWERKNSRVIILKKKKRKQKAKKLKNWDASKQMLMMGPHYEKWVREYSRNQWTLS